jgi:hypothetical protein
MNVNPPNGLGINFGAVVSPPDNIRAERAKASGKAKARYPDKPISVNQTTGGPGAGAKRALTPGTTPTGS